MADCYDALISQCEAAQAAQALADECRKKDAAIVVLEQTLRDYFAAHASRTPHPWFRPTMPTPRPALQFHDGHSEGVGCVYDGMCPALNRPAIDAYDAEFQRQSFVQWPYAWADVQIAQRDRQEGSP